MFDVSNRDVNIAPVAEDDSKVISENMPTSIEVLSNDSDANGDVLTIESVSNPRNGVAAISGSSISYIPNLNFSGLDSFTYTVSDGTLSDTATVGLQVRRGPRVRFVTAFDDLVTTDEDTVVSGSVFASNGGRPADFDSSGEPLKVVQIDGSAEKVGSELTLGAGRLIVNLDGTFVFDPNGGYETLLAGDSAVESFTYDITGGSGATVSITVAGISDGNAEDIPTVDGQLATAFVRNGLVVGNAFQSNASYNGQLSSNTDGTAQRNDVIVGTEGDDNIWSGLEGEDVISGGCGNDIIGFGAGDSKVTAGDGDDFVYAVGVNGSHRIELGSGLDNFYSQSGNNTIVGFGQNIVGIGSGDDTVLTADGNDLVYSVNGGGGANILNLGRGDNIVWLEKGNYAITTGSGNDSIGLGAGTDVVRAGDGDNVIYRVEPESRGDGDKDILTGSGQDFIQAGSGDDLIDGGTGSNTLFGGSGADTFVLREDAYHFIGDFELGVDKVRFANVDLTTLSFVQGNGDQVADTFIFLGDDAIAQVANTTAATFRENAIF